MELFSVQPLCPTEREMKGVLIETKPEQKVSENVTRHLSGLRTVRGSAGARRYFGARPEHSLPHFYFLPFLLNTKGKEGKQSAGCG